MNFIVKNLGWLLLLLFFVFMLFIISSSNKGGESGTGVLVTATGDLIDSETNDTLNQLIKLTDDSQDLISDESVIADVEEDNTAEDEVSGEQTSEGFFSRLFQGNKNEETTSDVELEVENDFEIDESKDDEDIVNIRDTLIGTADNSSLDGKNIGKRTGKIKKASTSIVAYPGTDLEAFVGKEYEIGVYSLKLNNKYFNETLGYMHKGDKVQQLSEENVYGCFEVEVLKNGNTGYVCKKYLAETTDVEPGNSVSNENLDIINTSIGSYYTADNDQGELTANDVLKQVSDSKGGCAEMKIVGSNIEINTGKIVEVCSLQGISPAK